MKITKWQRKRAYELTLPLHIRQKRRLAANARERKRMTSVNEAFEKLREILPNHHRDRPLSKMEALQLAQSYIKELNSTLSANGQDLFVNQQESIDPITWTLDSNQDPCASEMGNPFDYHWKSE